MPIIFARVVVAVQQNSESPRRKSPPPSHPRSVSKHADNNHHKGRSPTHEHDCDKEIEVNKPKKSKSGESKGCTYRTFMACKPEPFRGYKSTIKALRWIAEIETTLDISDCSTKNRVLYASLSFKGDARIWCKTVLASKGKEKVYAMRWKKFSKLFLRKCVPHHEVEKLENEYLHLRMVGTEHRKYT
jgi:hypothetical protein